MQIRPLAPPDRAAIERILRQGDTFNEMEIQVALELVDEVLRNPSHPDYFIYSAVLEPQTVAGFVCFGPVPLTDFSYDLYWIAVDRRHAKNGIGSRLMAFVEQAVREKSGEHIYVDTSSTQAYAAARGFYHKHGYRVACILEDFYRHGDHKVLFEKKMLS